MSDQQMFALQDESKLGGKNKLQSFSSEDGVFTGAYNKKNHCINIIKSVWSSLVLLNQIQHELAVKSTTSEKTGLF